MVVHSASSGVVPNGICRRRMASLPMITMHVNNICYFVCIFRYAASRYIFPIIMHFYGNFRRMADVMWGVRRMQNPSNHGWRVSLISLLFVNKPFCNGKYFLWMMRIFVYLSPFSLIKTCSETPIGATPEFMMWLTKSIVSVSEYPCHTSFPIFFLMKLC